MGRFLLGAKDTVLLIIDIQENLWNAMYNKDEIEKNAGTLVELASRSGIPVILTEQYKKGIGPTIKSLNERLPHVPGIEKLSFNCFDVEPFRGRLLSSDRKTLLIAGMEAHICVLQTALTAIEEGYRVHIVSDATGSRTEKNHHAGIERMRDAGCVITSAEMAVFEVVKEAGTPLFKDMLKLIK
jgi:nicotinamidase-related amidase